MNGVYERKKQAACAPLCEPPCNAMSCRVTLTASLKYTEDWRCRCRQRIEGGKTEGQEWPGTVATAWPTQIDPVIEPCDDAAARPCLGLRGRSVVVDGTRGKRIAESLVVVEGKDFRGVECFAAWVFTVDGVSQHGAGASWRRGQAGL